MPEDAPADPGGGTEPDQGSGMIAKLAAIQRGWRQGENLRGGVVFGSGIAIMIIKLSPFQEYSRGTEVNSCFHLLP